MSPQPTAEPLRVALVGAHVDKRYIPLSLLYLKAYLVERRGHPFDAVHLLEFSKDDTADTVVEAIVAARPDVVGFSTYVWNVRMFFAAADALKARLPGTKIVFGGPEVGPVAVDVLSKHASVDAVVCSEGEVPFADFVAALAQGHDLRGVAGIAHRADGRIVLNDESPIVKDLNDLPSPHSARYASSIGGPTGRIACVETQRGCVFRCNFCFYNKDFSIRNRRFDLDRVKRELAFWLEQDIRRLFLMDPIFNLNADRAKDICRFLIANNHRRIPLHAEIWAEFVDQELAELFQQAGFELLEVGLQTTDDTTLAAVERRLKLAPFVSGVNWLRASGLPFELQLIYGLPGETRETFRRSLNFAKSLQPTFLAVFPLMVLPGTALWRKTDALELSFEEAPPYFVRSHHTMSADDIAYGSRVIRALGEMGRSPTIDVMAKEPGVTFSDVVDDWIAWRETDASGGTSGKPGKSALPLFVEHVCRRRNLPSAFYAASAAQEAAT